MLAAAEVPWRPPVFNWSNRDGLVRTNMRAAEAIHIVVFSFFVALAWLRSLPVRRRAKVSVIGVAGLSATLGAAWVLPRWLPPPAVSVMRDWLPAALILLVYWQAGEFFVGADRRFQGVLERIDARLLPPLLAYLSQPGPGAWISACLELAYVLCYPMIPMSVAALYLLRLQRYADSFWIVVLISTYVSYGALPFLQSLPPRMLDEPWLKPVPRGAVRRFNLWILHNASIHANTFPSAHVAASTASALVLAHLAPWPVATIFSAIAGGISVGTFAGRYHFASDTVAGSAVAVVVFAITRYVQAL